MPISAPVRRFLSLFPFGNGSEPAARAHDVVRVKEKEPVASAPIPDSWHVYEIKPEKAVLPSSMQGCSTCFASSCSACGTRVSVPATTEAQKSGGPGFKPGKLDL